MKIFAFDLDGTILQNSSIESDMVTILKKLNEKHLLTFATSRSIRGIKAVLPDYLLKDALQVLCNGALVLFQNKVLYEATISHEEIKLLQSFLESNRIQYYVEFGNAYYIPGYGNHPFFEELKSEAPNEIVSSPVDFSCYHIYKIAILSTNNELLISELAASYSDKLHWYQYSDNTMDIVSKNASKWNALSNAANALFQENWDTISFGNDTNDYELLKNASLGVTMNPDLYLPDVIPLNSNTLLKKLLKQLI